MRSAKVWIPLAILLALMIGVSAQAGGKGALKVDLYEASPYVFWANYPDMPEIFIGRTVADGDVAGFVIFTPTAKDTMQITIKLENGPPNTTFDVNVVPGNWGSPPDLTLTTNGQGKGTAHVGLDIPDLYLEDGVASVKVNLHGDGAHYATDSRDPPAQVPDTNGRPPSTTHSVALK